MSALRALFGTLLCAAFLASFAPPATAQVTPADSAAVLLQAATDLEASGDRDAAQAIYRLILRRFGATPAAEGARLRLASTSGLRASGDGTTELRVWATTYGLWLGVAVPAAFGADESTPYGVGLLVGGPTGLLVGRAVTRRHQLTLGQARAITLGGTWGSWQGLALADILDLGEDYECFGDLCVSGDSEQERFAAMIVGGAAGIVVGSLLARNGVADATATGANHGALWGSWFGLATAIVGDVEDDGAMTLTALGGNAGLLGGALAGSRLGLSRNRIRMITVGGLVGGLGGLGIDLIITGESERTAAAIPLAGSVLGLAVAAVVTRDYATDGGDGGGGALFSFRDGGLTLGAPAVTPALVPFGSGRSSEWRPALNVPLFHASFF